MFVYRDKEPPSGNVLIVDIDGVLADASAHQHFLNGETQNWEAFFVSLDIRSTTKSHVPVRWWLFQNLQLLADASNFVTPQL